MRKAQIITMIGGLLAVVSVFLPWLVTPNLVDTQQNVLFSTGLQLPLGIGVIFVGGVVLLFTATTFIKRNKQLLIMNDMISSLLLLSLVSISFWYAPELLANSEPYVTQNYAPQLLLQEENTYVELIHGGLGYYLAMLGGLMVALGACVAYAARPHYKPGLRALRVEARWQGNVIKEKVFLEREPVSIGEDLRSTFVIPDSPVGRKYVLFKPDNKGEGYTLNLHTGLEGEVSIGGKIADIESFVRNNTANTGGANPVSLDAADFGVMRFGPLELVFRFVTPERQIDRVPIWRLLDHSVGAAAAISILIQGGFLSYTVIREWNVGGDLVRMRQAPPVYENVADINIDTKEEMIDMGEEEDTVGKKAGGEEGKFGDPDEDPDKQSKVPKKDGKFVDKIDPKKVGLNDLLSTNKLGGAGAISNIMSANSDGLSNKLAVAMSGEGTEFVMGHGSGGMGFKGTGTGGGGSGYGRIHGLGTIDTGGGKGVKAGLGRKGRRRVGNFKLGGMKSSGYCSKSNIQNVVRRRAGLIRGCYEKRLQVKPKLSGKITALWKIGLDGRVVSASIASSSMKDGTVEKCITRAIRRMRFQKPEGGMCIIRWPFVFRSGG